MLEIKFFGRGGQGVVKASQILGYGYFLAGMYPQCYSLFGGERRGAPLVSFLRVDKENILLKCEIGIADELIYLDDSLIDPKEAVGSLRFGGRILINTGKSQNKFEMLKNLNLGFIDAETIATGVGLGKTINTALLGAYCRFSGNLSLGDLLRAIEENVPGEKEANLEAARQGYSRLTHCKSENENDV